MNRVPFLLALFLILPPAHAAESLKADRVRVSWIAPKAFSTDAASVGVLFRLEKGWHLYWKNPGDSGAEPRFSFSSTNADTGDVQWPYPERMPYGEMVNLGYEGEVLFPLNVKPHVGTASVRVEAKLEWVVCKEECIAGSGVIALTRPVRAAEKWKTADRALLTRFEARVPRPAEESPWEITGARLHGRVLVVDLLVNDLPAPSEPPAMFPTDGERILPQAPTAEKTEGGFRLVFAVPGGIAPFSQTDFVLVEDGKAWEFSNIPVLVE